MKNENETETEAEAGDDIQSDSTRALKSENDTAIENVSVDTSTMPRR